jgi:DNA polymerase I
MILAVDAHNLIWRAFHALKSVGCRRKLIVANVLSMIDTCLDVIDAEHGVVAFDSVCHARAEIFPGYKAANETRRAEEDPKLRDERLAATERLKDVIFPACGFQTILAKGFEADDILASIAKHNPDLECHCVIPEMGMKPAKRCEICHGSGVYRDRVTILSSDEDLWQCVREGEVSTIKIKDGGKFSQGMTEKLLEQEYGLTPRLWPMVLAAAGGHDGIPGVPGIGKKTAVAWVQGNASDRVNAKMMDHRMEFRKYLKLVKLPLEGTPKFNVHYTPINRGAMLELIRKYRNG